jgi:hypothetical protein
MTGLNGRSLIFLELNEVNFDFLRVYASEGRLPAFASLIKEHGFTSTESEQKYEELEPWIQWVTAHTGKTYAEHRVFRLGDIINHDLPQVWEHLEERGLRVGAVSPMNAKNRLRDPAFFVPDPWTRTAVHAPPRLRRLYEAIAQVVNDNAQSRVSARSVFSLLSGFLAYADPSNWPTYIRYATTALGHPWRKAMFLDLLLADVFMREAQLTRPHFATLFLNAAAHIQHHYLFCSSAYAGSNRNPEWYVSKGEDPVFEVYELYDRIVATAMRRFPGARLMLATGLHQNPHATVTFYWRLRDHAAFLREVGVTFDGVSPRMSRDFLVTCGTAERAAVAARILEQILADDGTPLFEVDNRGSDLFVMLTYARDIPAGAGFRLGGRTFTDLRSRVAFVALKNGEHDGAGYLVDTGQKLDPRSAPIALASIPGLVTRYLLDEPFEVRVRQSKA